MNESEDVVMDVLEIMKERHSVRQYKNQAIEPSKREEISALINDVNAESKLSIQIFYDEPKCFDSFMAHYGKFENVKNYIAIVGTKAQQETYSSQKAVKEERPTSKLSPCSASITSVFTYPRRGYIDIPESRIFESPSLNSKSSNTVNALSPLTKFTVTLISLSSPSLLTAFAVIDKLSLSISCNVIIYGSCVKVCSNSSSKYISIFDF